MDYSGKIIRANPVTPTQTSASGVWTLDDAAAAVRNNSWPIVGVPNPISKSLRFNSADSAYLNRSFASSGNRKTWTWSCWFKKVPRTSETYTYIFNCSDYATNTARINAVENSTDSFSFNDSSISLELVTTAVYRDPSAWYHLVVVLDTTQATSSNRAKIYVNGSQVTALSTATYPAQNADGLINYVGGSFLHKIGTYNGSTSFFNGYMTEINFIDGQALTPSDFGQSNSNTGVWEPKPYTGTYGGNGFYLNFSDSSGVAALGNDYSGNNNDWTPNNFSVTAGVGNDSLTDVPTQWVGYSATNVDSGGIVRGNYCTLNPLKLGSTGTLSDGNLTWSSSSNQGLSIGTLGFNSGKWYFEFTCGSSVAGTMPGVVKTTVNSAANPNYPGVDANGWGYYATTGSIFNNGSGTAYGATFTTNDVIGVALDMDAGKIWWSKNGTFQNSGNPSSGTNAGFSNLPTDGTYLSPAIGSGDASTSNGSINFGQRPFAYTAPSGFKALCTQNLPPVTIGATSTTQANDYFNTVLYTGTGSSQSITGVGFQPDFVWIKERSGAADHGLYDAVRGVQKQMESNTITAESTETTGLTAFGTDGFTVGALAQLNTNTDTYVAWCWKANGAGSTNTAGTITSTVSANTTAGFSVLTYNPGNTSGTIGHGLGVAPQFIIVRSRTNSGGDPWGVYHVSLGNTKYLRLNTTDAAATLSTVWNDTSPTDTVVSIGTSDIVSSADTSFIMYCFAPVAGYSAFGSYAGNGSTDGPFVYTGFRPRFIMLKGTGNASGWQMHDTARDPYNAATNLLRADLSGAEGTGGGPHFDITSNGFKLRTTDTNYNNASYGPYIYAAFAENPFKYSLAR